MLTKEIKDGSIFLTDKGEPVLSIVVDGSSETEILVTLSGKLRSDTTHEVQDELMNFVLLNRKFVVDFKEVQSITPSVMNALLDIQQRIDNTRKGRMVLRNVSGKVFTAMDSTGMTELLEIE